jgi:transcriptional regulator with XRE-family HTH domain
MRMSQKTSELFASIGARLAITRNEIGLSQVGMAEALGVSHRAYHSYEKGQRGLPVETLVALHDRFQVDLMWILLGNRSAMVEHDLKALEDFEVALDTYLERRGIRLRTEKRGAIAARWYRSFLQGKPIEMDDVHTWIELLSE